MKLDVIQTTDINQPYSKHFSARYTKDYLNNPQNSNAYLSFDGDYYYAPDSWTMNLLIN